PAVQDQRAALVARRLLDARAADRSPRARYTLRVEGAAIGARLGARSPRRLGIAHPPRLPQPVLKESVMRRIVFTIALVSFVAGSTPAIFGFCGFYVSKADTRLFNKASQVVLVRDGDRTVMTMANDYEGEPKEFAVVIPVPTMLKREQIHVGDKALVDHLDAYSAPRLVEYFDQNPCERREILPMMRTAAPLTESISQDAAGARAKALGVIIEAKYTVGEYDILILSAQQSSGLETWLGENGYRIPAGATPVIASYLKQNMRFFVAKVNVAEHARLGF